MVGYDVFSILQVVGFLGKTSKIQNFYQVSLIEHVQQLAIAPVHRAPAAAPHEEEPNLRGGHHPRGSVGILATKTTLASLVDQAVGLP